MDAGNRTNKIKISDYTDPVFTEMDGLGNDYGRLSGCRKKLYKEIHKYREDLFKHYSDVVGIINAIYFDANLNIHNKIEEIIDTHNVAVKTVDELHSSMSNNFIDDNKSIIANVNDIKDIYGIYMRKLTSQDGDRNKLYLDLLNLMDLEIKK